MNSGFSGRIGCQGDGDDDGDGDGDGDHAANTVQANGIRLQGFKFSKTNLHVQNQQRAIGSGISHIKHCNWASQRRNKASSNLIEENAVAAYFIILRNPADVGAWGQVSESDFPFR